MQTLPVNLYRAAGVRELDRRAIEQYGIAGMTLMERAGQVAFTALHLQWPRAKKLAVLCGIGNNAGDGYVIARLADAAGLRVVVYQVGDVARLKGDALTAFERLEGTHVEVQAFVNHTLEQFDVLVDALLGTGLNGPVTGAWAEAITTLNQLRAQGKKVLAVDIPSGLNADTGSVMGCAVEADLTVTFIGLKQGQFTGCGPDYCGQLIFDNLGVPSEVYVEQVISCQRLVMDKVRGTLPVRRRCAHKGETGHVMVIGGNTGMTGALRMAGESALRCGAGRVTLVSRVEYAAALNHGQPELMCRGVESARELSTLVRGVTAIAIGPGLGQDEWASDLLAYALQLDLPLVVDADALNLLALNPQKRTNWVLTPHPTEAARLLQMSTREISQDRFLAVDRLLERYGGVSVLKGCGSLLVGEKVIPALCSDGNAGMASGGMGDVLCGVIISLIAQGMPIYEAACLGVCLHANAADLAVKKAGLLGLLATDLIPYLRQLINQPSNK